MALPSASAIPLDTTAPDEMVSTAAMSEKTTDTAVATDAEHTSLATPLDDEAAAFSTTDAAASTPPEPQYVTGIRMWLIVLALSLALFVTMLDMSIVSTAVPRITNQFHSLGDVGWYGAAYQLASAPMQPMSGKLYTYFRSKWMFLAFFALFELGSLICGVSTSSVMLIAGRAVAGLGAAGIQNGSLTILAGLAPLARRAFLTGIILGVAQLGIVAGPLLGGVFTEFATWRWCFYINLPIGAVVATLIAVIHIPEQTPKLVWRGQPPALVQRQIRMVLMHRVDVVGFVLFAGTAIQLLLALQWGGSVHAWSSATIIGLFVGFGATGIVWAVWNRQISHWAGTPDIPNRDGEAALVPLPIVRQRRVWTSGMTNATLMGVLIMHSYFIAIYFQAARDASPIRSGVNILPNIISQLLAAVGSSLLISKLGYYLPWAVGGMAINCIGTGLLSTLSPSTSSGRWIGFQIITGVGRGMFFQAPYLAIQHAVAPSQISIAIGLLSFGQNLGGAVLLTIANTIFDNVLKTELVRHAPDVSPDAVITAGATAFRTIVPSSSVPGVVRAYANSVDAVFYLATALSIVSFFCTFGLGWKDIRKKEVPKQAVNATNEEKGDGR